MLKQPDHYKNVKIDNKNVKIDKDIIYIFSYRQGHYIHIQTDKVITKMLKQTVITHIL